MMVKDREVWCVGVHGVTKSQTWLSTWTTTEQQIHMIISKIKSNQREPWVKNVINSGLRVYQLCTQTLFREQTVNFMFFWELSVQFSCSLVSHSLRPHELQHARPPCPSPTPGVHSDSRPLSQWCHPAISSSVVPFSSCPQSLPASESFPMSQLFAWGGQSIGVSASTSVLPMNTQDWSPLGWTGWISLQSKGLARVFSSTTVQKHQFYINARWFTVITQALKWWFSGEIFHIVLN